MEYVVPMFKKADFDQSIGPVTETEREPADQRDTKTDHDCQNISHSDDGTCRN
jgi:hypothetical protein